MTAEFQKSVGICQTVNQTCAESLNPVTDNIYTSISGNTSMWLWNTPPTYKKNKNTHAQLLMQASAYEPSWPDIPQCTKIRQLVILISSYKFILQQFMTVLYTKETKTHLLLIQISLTDYYHTYQCYIIVDIHLTSTTSETDKHKCLYLWISQKNNMICREKHMQEGSKESREAAKVRSTAPLSGENTQTTFSQRGSCD